MLTVWLLGLLLTGAVAACGLLQIPAKLQANADQLRLTPAQRRAGAYTTLSLEKDVLLGHLVRLLS